jgi:hypothetical protein
MCTYRRSKEVDDGFSPEYVPKLFVSPLINWVSNEQFTWFYMLPAIYDFAFKSAVEQTKLRLEGTDASPKAICPNFLKSKP